MKTTRQPTELAKTIAGGDMRGDSDAKRLFQINEIAAWFLKSCVEEFSQMTIQDIVSGWIAKADRRLGTEPIMLDSRPRARSFTLTVYDIDYKPRKPRKARKYNILGNTENTDFFNHKTHKTNKKPRELRGFLCLPYIQWITKDSCSFVSIRG